MIKQVKKFSTVWSLHRLVVYFNAWMQLCEHYPSCYLCLSSMTPCILPFYRNHACLTDSLWKSALLRRIHSPRDKSILFFENYAPCICYLIDFLCIICYNDHFTWRKCILYGPGKGSTEYTLVSLIFMHQNFAQLQKVNWKIVIHRYLMYRISDDHKRTMNKANETGTEMMKSMDKESKFFQPVWQI